MNRPVLLLIFIAAFGYIHLVKNQLERVGGPTKTCYTEVKTEVHPNRA